MTRAATLLNDEDNTRWPLAELAIWINEAVRAIILAKPSASTTTVNASLAPGTRQTVPSTGTPTPLNLINATRNVVVSGEVVTAGRAVTITDRAALDEHDPGWHDIKRAKKTVLQVMFDDLEPLAYWVYPPNDGTGTLELVCSALPAPIPVAGNTLSVWESADIGINEPYSPAILDYVLFRAMSKDDIDASIGKSQMHYQAFATAIGVKIQGEMAQSPNRRRGA